MTRSEALFLLFICEGWREFLNPGTEQTIVLCKACQYVRGFETIPEPPPKKEKAPKGLVLRDTKRQPRLL